jgi:hypothetical protein
LYYLLQLGRCAVGVSGQNLTVLLSEYLLELHQRLERGANIDLAFEVERAGRAYNTTAEEVRRLFQFVRVATSTVTVFTYDYELQCGDECLDFRIGEVGLPRETTLVGSFVYLGRDKGGEVKLPEMNEIQLAHAKVVLGRAILSSGMAGWKWFRRKGAANHFVLAERS